MRFDLEHLASPVAYKLLAATVVPRPIAWVTTVSAQGQPNAAPYSFFNIMGSGEFVVNLVPEALVRQMNITAVDAPNGINELDLAGLAPAASTHVRPPRIAASPVSFECVNHATVVTGPHQSVVIGRILAVHIADAFVQDAERGHIDTRALGLVGRSYGSTYIRTHDTFELQRPTWASWTAEQAKNTR